MWNLKWNDANELICKTEADSLTENELMVTRGEGLREGIVREFGTDMYTLLYLKQVADKDLFYRSLLVIHTM